MGKISTVRQLVQEIRDSNPGLRVGFLYYRPEEIWLGRTEGINLPDGFKYDPNTGCLNNYEAKGEDVVRLEVEVLPMS